MPSKIEWTDETWNPVIGCTKCSPGCLNCYAERMAIRLNGIFAAKGDDDNWAKMSNVLKWDYSKYELGKAVGWNGEVELFTNRLDKPFHLKKPRRIFVCSMSDLFHPKVPLDFQIKVMDVTQECLQHTFLILTKRPENAKLFFGGASGAGLNRKPLPNVHLGISISTPNELWKVDELKKIPVAVRFLSIEPLLAGIEFTYDRLFCDRDPEEDSPVACVPCLCGKHWENSLISGTTLNCIDWVLVGCESGPKRRPCKMEWVYGIINQCEAAGVPCFVKQININGKVVKKPKGFPQKYPRNV